MQAQFYTAMRERNVFINQPDMYFYQGGSKAAMGYDEVYSCSEMNRQLIFL
jgi:hypothetical protein